jgi:mono/diheme cytochrome c family protein
MNNMMTKITVGIVALLLMAGIFVLFVARGESARLPAKEADFSARSVENGALIFEANCVGCHGVQGKGIPGVAPALNSPEFFTTRLEEVGYAGSLRTFIEGTVNAGRPVGSGQYSAKMATWGQEYGGPLRPDQIHDVASFILNWETTAVGGEQQAAQPTPTALPSDASPVDIGKAVYTASGCAGCHGEPGGAGIVGPSITGIATRAGSTVPGLSAEDYIRESIVNPNAYIAPECPSGPCAANLMPQTFGQTLSPDELDGLIQYLLTLE